MVPLPNSDIKRIKRYGKSEFNDIVTRRGSIAIASSIDRRGLRADRGQTNSAGVKHGEERHINHLQEMGGFEEFFKMLDGYCMKFQLKMKKGGPVIYTEDSYQAYHKDDAKYHTRVILQLGGFGKKFCLKKGADE
ncbi:hypothetical protein THAOC_25560 [Thalassiosira oceanica]|uniref:Uncharacterized protein n=1 Tax=Thalassiosira oceanica TaxID=159749 RepID=K0RM47_THAOC|nr:hypothetical protein THAOC_25560 [Thalassiosira oceanica]|eukprot:EJK54783.1 hypothetical protein THAOC_25560 [Thalassiosira oceanica]